MLHCTNGAPDQIQYNTVNKVNKVRPEERVTPVVTTLTGPVEHHVPPVGARFTVVEEHTVPTDVRLTSDNKVHKVSCANASNASSAFNAYCPPNKVRYADCSSVYFNVDTTELSIKKLVSSKAAKIAPFA